MPVKPKNKQLVGVVVVIGLLVAGKGLWEFLEVQDIPNWQKIYGTVIESRFLQPNLAQIIYEYKHPRRRNLKIYSCSIMPGQDSIRISGTHWGRSTQLHSCKNRAIAFNNAAEAQEWVRRFPVGKVVEVYFDDGSYLDHKPQHATWMPWILGGGLVMLAGIVILVFLGRSTKKPEPAPRP